MSELVVNKQSTREAFKEINEKSDRVMSYAIFVYFAFGIVLSFFYQTYFIAIASGGACVLAYFITRYLLPNSSLYQYVMSSVLAIFSAQFIYQMHGMFEMHFFFFVGSALLITFRNWRLIIPLLLITVVHHATFAWLQYQGMKEIYFTQLDYMDLQAFIFHAFLAAVIMGICGYWAYDLERTTWSEFRKTSQLAGQLVNVKNNIEFADNISKGNLDVSYTLLDQTDELGQSLVRMRENLKSSSARENEDKFITVGITKVGDVIRNHGNDLPTLADEFIRGLVKYANLNQGGLFILEQENGEEYLNLAACYAYDRKKFAKKRVEIGEGLVGQCFLERDEIYMTVVPKDYVRITSGLGESTPRSILLVPVKTQDEIVGVIELASFRELAPFEKQFVHKAAENIASAIISSRTTTRIKRLLDESQQRSEDLRSQEEELRQNMEELSATQEEMARKAIETESRISAIENSGIASIEFNLDGTIITANKHFLDLMEYSLDEIKNRHHGIFVDAEYRRSEAYANFWRDLAQGVSRPGEYSRVTKSGKRVFIKGSYSVIRDESGRPTRVIKLANDITALKTQQDDMTRKAFETESRVTAIENSGIASIEFNLDGTIITANKTFLDLMEYSLPEITGKHHGIFVDSDFRRSKEYADFWKDLAQGVSRPGEYSRVTKNGKRVFIKGSYSVIRDEKGNPTRVLKLANDITPLKIQQEEMQKTMAALNDVQKINAANLKKLELNN